MSSEGMPYRRSGAGSPPPDITPPVGIPAVSGIASSQSPSPTIAHPIATEPIATDANAIEAKDTDAGPTARRPTPTSIRRQKRVVPFQVSQLERIPRETVTTWKLLDRIPAALRSGAAEVAVTSFLAGLLNSGDDEGRELAVTIKAAGGTASETKRFPDDEITIGSHVKSLIQLSGASVSRRHARLVFDERGYCLVDQGSRNGTYLHGERCDSGYAYPLKNGESFSVPGHELTVHWNERPEFPHLRQIDVAALRVEDADRFVDGSPNQGVAALVRREPGGEMLAIDCDLSLARLLVDAVLGRSHEEIVTPILELEQGVLELLAAKMLAAAKDQWGPEIEWVLQLVRVCGAADPAVRRQLGSGSLLVVTVALDFDSRRETVRLAVPSGLLEQFPRAYARAGESIEELYLRLRDVVGLAQVELVATVGQSMLTPSELSQLRAGDIVVPDSFGLTIADDVIEGRVELRPMQGLRGATTAGAFIAGSVIAFSEQVHVDIDTISIGPPAPEVTGGSMDESGDELDAIGEGAAMLEDVALPMVVELGRVHLSVRDLAGLRKGQVLDLGRSAEDPVHLVVEGRVIGTGRLVNVEGEIGVQIVELLR